MSSETTQNSTNQVSTKGRLRAAIAVFAITGILAFWVSTQSDSHVRLQVVGDLKRVSTAEIHTAVDPWAKNGIFRASVGKMQQAIVDLPWVQQARVERVWPHGLRIHVWEQEAIARWNDDQAMNADGEVFERGDVELLNLPKLEGPEDQQMDVLALHELATDHLDNHGLVLVSTKLTDRGHWQARLANGVVLQLGRRDVLAHLKKRLPVLVGGLSGKWNTVQSVDMRYEQGFAVQWRNETELAEATNRNEEG